VILAGCDVVTDRHRSKSANIEGIRIAFTVC